MKHPILIVFSLFILCTSCDNELVLNAEWENIPIVYGILEEQEQIQYIRVEKGFIDAETSALEVAKRTDSIYYSNTTVQLERPDFNETILLERVNATEEGLAREMGIFADEPNILYKLDLGDTEPLQGGELVRLSIIDDKDEVLASAETQIVESFTLINGQPGDPLNFSEYDRPVRISWRPEGDAAAIYDVQIIINYEESLPNDATQFVDKSVTWQVRKNLLREGDDRMGIQILGEELYIFLDGALEESATQIRRFRDLEVVVTAAGNELAEYIRVRQANTGITSSQIVPTFSNIEGGLGLFSSSAQVSRGGIRITPSSLDSLAEGIHTQDLGFR